MRLTKVWAQGSIPTGVKASALLQGPEELTMNKKDEVPKKGPQPQLVKLDRALNLAEKWVKNMSKSSVEQSSKVVLKARPPRLGLGVAVPRQVHVAPVTDPVERNLRGKLNAVKRKIGKDAEEFVPSVRDETVDEDSEEELESRSKAIVKKPTTNSNSILQARKRQMNSR